MKHHLSAAGLQPIKSRLLSIWETLKLQLFGGDHSPIEPTIIVCAGKIHQFREKILSHTGPRSR